MGIRIFCIVLCCSLEVPASPTKTLLPQESGKQLNLKAGKRKKPSGEMSRHIATGSLQWNYISCWPELGLKATALHIICFISDVLSAYERSYGITVLGEVAMIFVVLATFLP